MADPSLSKSEVNFLSAHGRSVGPVIGGGKYCQVLELYNKTTPSKKRKPIACKVIDTRKASRSFARKCTPHRLKIIRQLKHPNIIQVYGIYPRKGKVFIFMELAENGDLFEHIKKFGFVEEPLARWWFAQITQAVRYIHRRNIAHRDLKCENVLLTEKLIPKLCDFDFARYTFDSSGSEILTESYCGSMVYSSPEVVGLKPYDPKLADVWSLGCILFIMLNKRYPFKDSSTKELKQQQMAKKLMYRKEIYDRLSQEVKDLISHMLEPNIQRRFTVDNVLGHKWIKTSPSKKDRKTDKTEK